MGKRNAPYPEENKIIDLHENVEQLRSNNKHKKLKYGDKGNGKDKGKLKGRNRKTEKGKKVKNRFLVLQEAKERGYVQSKYVQQKMVLVRNKYRWKV